MQDAAEQASTVISFSHEIVIKNPMTGARGVQQLPDQFGYWESMSDGAVLHMWAMDEVAKAQEPTFGFPAWED